MSDPAIDDPPFFEAHPPLMTDENVLPPHRSAYQLIGKPLIIKSSDMNRVMDPKYEWRKYADRSEFPYREKVRAILAKRDLEVDHYELVRRRYWEYQYPYQFPVETDETVTRHRGVTRHSGHTVDTTKSLVERLAIDLSFDISKGGAAAPGGDPPPVPPILVSSVGGGSSGGGPSGNTVDLQFSREMTNTLHITDTDETTYTDETTTTIQQKFEAGVTYIPWKMKEECVIFRVLKGATTPDPDPISMVIASTPFDYTDTWPKSGGDIH
jgi:hypothetical protein